MARQDALPWGCVLLAGVVEGKSEWEHGARVVVLLNDNKPVACGSLGGSGCAAKPTWQLTATRGVEKNELAQ